MQNIKYSSIQKKIFSFFILSFVFSGNVFASTADGTITPGNSTAKICRDASGTSCADFFSTEFLPNTANSSAGIHIIDSSSTITADTIAPVTGKAWNSGCGEINFAPTNATLKTNVNVVTGVFSGQAWSQSCGWIIFGGGINSSSAFTSGSQRLTINTNGQLNGYAWVSEANGGWMVFDCGNVSGLSAGGVSVVSSACVKTDWRPKTVTTTAVIVPSGGGGGGSRTIFDACPLVPGVQTSATQCSIKTVKLDEKKSIPDPVSTPDPIKGTLASLLGGDEPNVPKEFKPYVCKRYMKEYITYGEKNNPEEVKKLQNFLNMSESENLEVDGLYKKVDVEAVKRFQTKYADQILSILSEPKATGKVGRTTVVKINLMLCSTKTTCPYFNEYLKSKESSFEVVRVQDFLNIIASPISGYPTNGISLSKFFDKKKTSNAVKDFQTLYKKIVLDPWSLKKATGRWYKTSVYAANKLLNCKQDQVKLENGKIIKY